MKYKKIQSFSSSKEIQKIRPLQTNWFPNTLYRTCEECIKAKELNHSKDCYLNNVPTFNRISYINLSSKPLSIHRYETLNTFPSLEIRERYLSLCLNWRATIPNDDLWTF